MSETNRHRPGARCRPGRAVRAWRGMPALAFVLGLAAPASAEAPQFIKVTTPVTAKEAFEDDYGQLIVNELHRALLKGAEPSCLAGKEVTADKVRDRGEDILIRFGQAIDDKLMAAVDGNAADKAFTLRGGATALADLQRLLKDPAVAELLLLIRPGDRDRLVERTTEMFDQFVSLNRIKLDPINPRTTGSYLVEKSRADSSGVRAHAFVQKNDTPAMRRYLDLVEAAGAALEAAKDRAQLERHDSNQVIADLAAELAAMCIVTD